MKAVETLPTSINEKETHWLRRAVTSLHHHDEAKKQKVVLGIWGFTRSTRLQSLAVRNSRFQ
eukprot:1144403-Pelagomonas_calceolata.AAC.3